MKRLLLTYFALTASLFVFGQIKNPGFELMHDTITKRPENWSIQQVDGYVTKLDEKVKFSGKSSFSLRSRDTTDPGGYIPFSQVVSIDVQKLKKLSVTAYVKTLDLKGRAEIWCQVWDKNNKQIGFQNLNAQNVRISGTTDWKKYALTLLVNPSAKKLLLGGYLQGSGAIWYDQFDIEDGSLLTEPPANEVVKYVKEFTGIIKKHSIYSDSLNWAAIANDLVTLSKGLKTIDDAQILTGYIMNLLRAAGDNHSFMQSKTVAENYATKNVVSAQPSSKLLVNDIGYVSVPGFGSISDTAGVNFAEKIQNLIHHLDAENTIKGWIIDLRDDGGGNMHPMIAGLGPLVGNGTLGYFISPNSGGKNYSWNYKNGTESIGGHPSVRVKHPYTIKEADPKIAVLIGPKTASSGEMTAISFIGKQNIKLIGQQTGGYTTANEGYKLSNGAYLYLASSFTADRNKKKYTGKINPDILIRPTAKDNSDATIDAAIAWIMDK